MSTRLAFLVGSACALSLSTAMWTNAARAQDKTAVAETLFRDGKALMEAGNYDTACPKLLASEQLDPASGTMLALAYCYEKAGKTASAWSSYQEAASLARRDGMRDRDRAATTRAKALEPKLAKLRITVNAETRALDQLEVKAGSVSLGPAVWGSDVPMDAGEVHVTARAKGRRPFDVAVTLHDGDAPQEVVVPALEPEPAPVVVKPEEPKPAPKPVLVVESPRGMSTRRLVGYGVGGAGIIAVGVGTYFGLAAKSKNDDANAACPAKKNCGGDATSSKSTAQTDADIATVLFSAGLVAVAAGAVLVITGGEPKPEAKASFVFPIVTRTGGGVGWSASF